MSRALRVAALLVVHGASLPAQSPNSGTLRDAAHRYYTWRDSVYPVGSSDQGRHTWDDRLADYHPAAIRARRQRVRSLLSSVRAMRTGAWSTDDRVDWLLFRAQLAGADFFGREMQPEESDPQVYSNEIANGVFSLLKRTTRRTTRGRGRRRLACVRPRRCWRRHARISCIPYVSTRSSQSMRRAAAMIST